MFTDRLGDHPAKFDEDDLELLADFIERCGFFDWRDEYRPEVELTDHPGYELEVVRNRVKKAVSQYAVDEPPDFWVIAALVDGIAGRLEWTSKV